MSKLQVTDMLARAFAAEGVDTLFTLMGDANMYWSVAMSKLPGMKVVHARHEHCAVAMADGYARATGKVGVASTTCGPGFTQIMTALTISARSNTPLVVFAGDAPLTASWYIQQIDMAPLTLACGAHFVGIKHIDRVLDNVREAFQIAQAERKPVVLSVPMDLQKQAWPHLTDYTPSSELVPTAQRPLPDPAMVDRVVDMIAEAEKPVVLAGRGVIRSGARTALETLAEQSGALLATSLLGKGLFDGNPYALDIAGSFASDFARERFAEADLVIGVGAGLGHYTTEGGYLYPGARTVQIDTDPRGLWQGLRTADLHVRADAKAAAEAITARMKARHVSRTGFRNGDMAQQIAKDSPDSKEFQVQPNTVDPRKAILELDQAIPKDWDIVVGGGHYFSIAMTHMKGRPADKYHVVNEFGAIGSGLPAAIGIGARRRRRQGHADRGRRQPVDAHPGARDDPPPGHPHADLGDERRRLRCGVPQVPRQRHRSRRGHARPRRPCRRGDGLRPARCRRHRDGPLRAVVPRASSGQHRLGVGHPHRRSHPVARLPPRALRRGVKPSPALTSPSIHPTGRHETPTARISHMLAR